MFHEIWIMDLRWVQGKYVKIYDSIDFEFDHDK